MVCLEHFTDGWVKVEFNGVIGIIPASYLREYEAPADSSSNQGSNPPSPHEVRAKRTESPNPEEQEKKSRVSICVCYEEELLTVIEVTDMER